MKFFRICLKSINLQVNIGIILIFGFQLFFLDRWVALGLYYVADWDNLLGGFLCVSALGLVLKKIKDKGIPLKSKYRNKNVILLLFFMLFACFEILNLVRFQNSRISYFIWFIGSLALLGLYFKFKQFIKSFYLIIALFSLSLPIYYLLNSTLGILLRGFYVKSINMLIHVEKISDTFLIIGDRAINIDLGCSGVFNMILITGIVLIKAELDRSAIKKTLLLLLFSQLIYVVLNLFQMTILSYIHLNIYSFEVSQMHEVMSLVVTIFTIIIIWGLFKVNLKSILTYNEK